MSDSPSTGAKATAPEVVGEMAGEYRLVRKLGEGGFGAVYEAEHPLLKRRAAVKVLHRAARMDSDALLRFISEAQAANQIRSRHIVDIFSFGKLADGRHFYVMDLLHGEPLDRFLDREKRIDVPRALQLLRPIAEALDAAHAAGIVHRDLKPQNVFLVWDPGGDTVPKLLDFGTAKLLIESLVETASGTPVGTPLYMSPEQARGEKVDGRADVYALGVLCHEMLTGQMPINGNTTLVVLMAQLSSTPPRVSVVCPDLPPQLDDPILRMLAKDPEARFASAGAALAALISAAESAGQVIPAGMPRLPLPPPSPEAEPASPRSSRPGGASVASLARNQRGARRWWPVWVLAALVLAGVAGTMAYVDRRSALPSNSPAPVAVPAPVPVPVPVAPTPPGPVQLTIHGAPRGGQVSLDGQLIGATPGPLPIPHGTRTVDLVISAPGHEPARLTVIPERDLTATVSLKRRATTRTRPSIPRDLENPF
jgi:eukaryotic-like serine/threonine-protein kinase